MLRLAVIPESRLSPAANLLLHYYHDCFISGFLQAARARLTDFDN